MPETTIGGSTHYYNTKIETPPTYTFCPHIDNYGFPNPIKNDSWKNFAHKGSNTNFSVKHCNINREHWSEISLLRM